MELINAMTFDIETRKLANDVGGWGALKRGEGGASAIVVWSGEAGRPYLFDDNCVEDAVALLESAPCVVSFNGIGFDVPILEGLLGRKLRLEAHIDLLDHIWSASGRRSHKGYGLGPTSERTLGRTKTEDAKMAPELADSGQFGRLFNYCLEDVLLTRDLARYIQEHQGVIDTNGGILPLNLPQWFQKAAL